MKNFLKNEANLPLPVLKVFESYLEKSFREFRYSPSNMTRGILQLILDQVNDNLSQMDVGNLYKLMRGNHIHEVIAKYLENEARIFIEQELAIPLKISEKKELNFTGTCDLIHERENFFDVYDWKTCSVNKFIFQSYEDHINQLSLYAEMIEFMFAKTSKKVENLFVVLLFDDWVESKKFEPGYPQNPVICIKIQRNFNVIFETIEKIRLVDQGVEAYKKNSSEFWTFRNEFFCTSKERWQREKTWALIKHGNKRASKVFYSESEIPKEITSEFFIEERQGQSLNCERYCKHREICQRKNSFL